MRSMPDGDTNQAAPVWSPDGTRLLYFDDGQALPDRSERRRPQPGGHRLCRAMHRQFAGHLLAAMARRIAFVRDLAEAPGYFDLPTVATMDLASGGRRTALDGPRRTRRRLPPCPPMGPRSSTSATARRTAAVPTHRGLTPSGWSMPTATSCDQLSPTTLAAAEPRMVPGRRPDPVRVASSTAIKSIRTSTRSGPTGPMCAA